MPVMLWGLAGVALFVVLFLAMFRSKWREELGDTGDLDPPRRVGKHPALGASYRQGPVMSFGEPTLIILTPRDLEHINITRRCEGAHPMSAAGFRAVISDQARMGTSPIHFKDEWLTYLVAAQVLFPEHQSHRVAVETTIAIESGKPFNGQRGID